jgi:hemerythrin-like domain-containing protein
MSRQQESVIAVSFLNIHNIITRSLRVSLENAQVILQGGFRDERTREGFFNYIQALTSVMKAHHLMEDEVAFPYFRDKLPDADFDNLTFWHHKMDEILDEIKLAVEKFEKNDQLEIEMWNIENALSRLNDGWPLHILPETDDFINKADALVPVEEQLRLARLFAEHSQKLAIPHYLTVPFMIYNLPVEDRKVFSQGIPAEVLQNLIPVVWKEKWESMKPYLLA